MCEASYFSLGSSQPNSTLKPGIIELGSESDNPSTHKKPQFVQNFYSKEDDIFDEDYEELPGGKSAIVVNLNEEEF